MPDPVAGERTWTIKADGPDGRVDHFYADTDLMEAVVVELSRLRAAEETLDRTLEEGQRTRLRLLGEVRAAEEREENLRHQRGLLVQELAVLAHTLRPFAQHEPGVVYDKHDSLETVVDHILEAFGEQGR